VLNGIIGKIRDSGAEYKHADAATEFICTSHDESRMITGKNGKSKKISFFHSIYV